MHWRWRCCLLVAVPVPVGYREKEGSHIADITDTVIPKCPCWPLLAPARLVSFYWISGVRVVGDLGCLVYVVCEFTTGNTSPSNLHITHIAHISHIPQ